MALSNFLIAMLPEGIGIVLESAKETAVEISTLYIAEQLNKIRWAGEDTWSDKIIESYIDNLRGNLHTSVTANIVHNRIAKVQVDNIKIMGIEKGKQYYNSFMSRKGV